VENNFAHDSQGYCVSVFGAEGPSGNSTASTIRRNTCIHNGRSPRLAKRQGAIYLSTWQGGKLNGVTIEDNTVVWEPPLDTPAFKSTAEFTGNLPNRFADNTILAASGSFVASGPNMRFADNLYCAPKKTAMQFSFAGTNYADPVPSPPVYASDQSGRGAVASPSEPDAIALERHELCGCLQELLARTGGADQRGLADRQPAPRPHGDSGSSAVRYSLSAQANRWVLFAVLTPEGAHAAESRSQLVLMESMMNQFGSFGLASVVAPAHAMSKEQLDEWQSDWNFDPKVHVDGANAEGLRKAYNVLDATQLLLISPSGEVAARWTYPVSSADVWLQLQSRLGTPAGMQPMPNCTQQPEL
jgi:hypothetical protein